ncbi:DUF5997 family protein [Naasia lichenicola]|uniref:Uncharacterized protein n=1 Tax=Naasia lichenicola TaxID=2565933 RepID=A0A4S4FUV9_9MICO|nr:DUF5997 family protein [Naasia lichenicola]THG33635.1 hypothetical protein E6C64_04055 [Naasia lichenicola]
MKPATAAKKLGILADAAPEEFRNGVISRDTLAELSADPPQWLLDLRANGPHPRQVVAAKLGVSTSGLARAGVNDPLTTAEISDLLTNRPKWLVTERATQAGVRQEKERISNERRGAEALAGEDGDDADMIDGQHSDD